eukprot:1909196-Alexandrium_andersonii.AAC.1
MTKSAVAKRLAKVAEKHAQPCAETQDAVAGEDSGHAQEAQAAEAAGEEEGGPEKRRRRAAGAGQKRGSSAAGS